MGERIEHCQATPTNFLFQSSVHCIDSKFAIDIRLTGRLCKSSLGRRFTKINFTLTVRLRRRRKENHQKDFRSAERFMLDLSKDYDTRTRKRSQEYLEKMKDMTRAISGVRGRENKRGLDTKLQHRLHPSGFPLRRHPLRRPFPTIF